MSENNAIRSLEIDTSRRRVCILGVEIDSLTMDNALKAFESLILRGSPAIVYSVNVDICMKIQQDPELRGMFGEADLVLVDGTHLMWAARILGSPLAGRVSGSDLVPTFCALAAMKGYRIYFLGAAPGIAERAKQFLQGKYPDLRIVGTYAPPIGFDTDDYETAKVVDLVRAADPDVLFAAFGAPKQEKWLFRNRDALRVPVSMGVGSSLDYLAGRLRRAPRWMQVLGLEWAYRLVQEPGRLWRRYLISDPPFFYYLFREMLRQRNETSRQDSG